jgi:hypothetical protein
MSATPTTPTTAMHIKNADALDNAKARSFQWALLTVRNLAF